jgi:hypothetical protein
MDAALSAHVGELGRGQFIIVLVTSLCQIPMAMLLMLMVLTSLDPVPSGEWYCVSEQARGDGAAVSGLGPHPNCQEVLHHRPINTKAFCALPRDSWEWAHPGHSLISSYDLHCQRQWQVDLINALYFVGLALGGTIFGWMSDR